MASYKILLIDDDPSMVRSLGNYFEELGHAVFRAATGEEGLAIHEKVRPDVTVLDLVTPTMSGMQVLEILGRRQATVIMLTGQGEIETAVEAMRLGAENFLVKPVDLGHLNAAIEKASEKSLLRSENVALRRQLNPSAKRRLIRLALLLLLVLVSTGVGRVIGGSGGTDRPRSPIPVPSDSADPLRNRQQDQSPDSG